MNEFKGKNIFSKKNLPFFCIITSTVITLIVIFLIVFNFLNFNSRLDISVAGNQGGRGELFKKYFVSDFVVPCLHVISVQGALAALFLVMGIHLSKAEKYEN